MAKAANIILTGMPGSGKSAAGEALAVLLRTPFAETDAEIEKTAGKTIAAVFAEEGETVFREMETAALKKILAADGQIVSTGGGAVLSSENRGLIRKRGRVVYLSAAPSLLQRRLEKDAAARPLLAGKNPAAAVAELFAAREVLYQKTAHLAVVQHREDKPEDVAKKIAAGLKYL